MRRSSLLALFLFVACGGGAATRDSSGGDSGTGTRADDGGVDENPADDGGTAADDASAVIKKDSGAPTDAGSSGDAGAYAAIENLSDNALRVALKTMVDGHTSLGYDTARDVMLGVTGTFDLTGGMLECVYTGKKVAPDGTRTPNGFNTEHTWPQSLGASNEPARSDLHHLYPVDENANTARGNNPYADTDCSGASCSFDNGGSQLGPVSGGATVVWEVRPARRGDVARGMFYFAVRYDKNLDAMQEAALREWNDADPPDALERARNDAIEGYQKNRNPFVDRPDFVAKISDF
ncbi:MAG: endonuclease [Polyangiaceae bacterium]